MVSRRRHFVPNPVAMHSTDSRPKRHTPRSLHTRYDADGNVTSLTDPDHNVTSWAYDQVARETSETNASGTEYFAYDSEERKRGHH